MQSQYQFYETLPIDTSKLDISKSKPEQEISCKHPSNIMYTTQQDPVNILDIYGMDNTRLCDKLNYNHNHE